jgi:exosome complex RNA-binding protein Csl4
MLGVLVLDLKTTCKVCGKTPIYCAQKVNVNFDKLINLETNHSELGALLARQINELIYQRENTRCHECGDKRKISTEDCL